MKSSKPIVQFNLLNSFKFTERKRTKEVISNLFKQEGKVLKTLNYIFCSDDYLLKINQDYLQHDTLTDIITFDLSGSPDAIEGEIYISVDRVKDNAHSYNVPFLEELHRVMFHGALHLCGYKDKKSEEKTEMKRKENFYLLKYQK
jgi:probable rRNA maturation factor